MGWLHSSPPLSKQDDKPQSRFSRLPDFSPFKGLPDCGRAQDLCEHFHRAGLVHQSGAGASPLSWIDVQAYSQQSGFNLSGWESEQLLNMSREYFYLHRQATADKSYPAPYSRELSAQEAQEWRDSMVKGAMQSSGNIKVVSAPKQINQQINSKDKQ